MSALAAAAAPSASRGIASPPPAATPGKPANPLDIAKNPIVVLTGELLAWSWRSLIATFGLTLLYINLHFVVRYIAGSQQFSPFGQALRFGKISIGGKGAEFAEIIAMLVLDVLAAIALFVALLASLLAALPLLIPILGPATIVQFFSCDLLHLVAPLIGGAWSMLAGLCPGP